MADSVQTSSREGGARHERKQVTLTVHGSETANVFRLLGADENSATFALGWLLNHSLHMRRLLVGAVFNKPQDVKECVIALQKHSLDGGYTDIEVQAGNRWHFVLEAKRGWDVPSRRQLAQYSTRLKRTQTAVQRLVTVSAADRTFAAEHLPRRIDGIGVSHFSWTDIAQFAKRAQALARGFEERLWLRQFAQHLKEYVSMERTTDNTVYVLSLGIQPMVKGKRHNWIDVVEKDQCYFHPVGNHWPVQPPNYVGFRYRGTLQSVHHVDSFSVVRNLATVNRLWPKTKINHFVYRLGPAMRPAREMRAGKVFRSARVWCAIDTLLSGDYKTLSDARDETKKRLLKETV
jgi:hypothetical protein